MSEKRKENLLKKLAEGNITTEEKKELRKLLIDQTNELEKTIANTQNPTTKRVLQQIHNEFVQISSVLPS